MNFMNLSVYQETEIEIKQAFKNNDLKKLKKETSFILCLITVSLQTKYCDRIKSILLNPYNINFDESYIISEDNYVKLLTWLKQLLRLKDFKNDYDFGKFLLDLEEWFYKIGGNEICFKYQDSYLLNSKDVVKEIGLSISEYLIKCSKYSSNGSQFFIPKHIVELWKDPIYCLKIQILHYEKKLRNQTPYERYQEILKEISKYKNKYKVDSVKEAFADNDVNLTNFEDLKDYYEWYALEEEYHILKKILNIN